VIYLQSLEFYFATLLIFQSQRSKSTEFNHNATLSLAVASGDVNAVNMPQKRSKVGCSQFPFMVKVEYSQLMVNNMVVMAWLHS
jgi:hypothetical protein